MFQMRGAAELKALLDGFEVPMFAVERTGPGAPWVLSCINAAHQAASGMPADENVNRKVTELLPEADADWVCARYDECARIRAPLRYLEKLTIAGQRQEWDTSLQWLALPGGGERLIGTALVLPKRPATATRSALSTIRDQAVEADWHLSRVTSFLESAAALPEVWAERPAARLALQAEGLAAICRSVSSLISNMRRIAESETRHSPGCTPAEGLIPRPLGTPAGEPACAMRLAEHQMLHR